MNVEAPDTYYSSCWLVDTIDERLKGLTLVTVLTITVDASARLNLYIRDVQLGCVSSRNRPCHHCHGGVRTGALRNCSSKERAQKSQASKRKHHAGVVEFEKSERRTLRNPKGMEQYIQHRTETLIIERLKNK